MPSNPVTGSCKLREIDGNLILTISTKTGKRRYVLTRLTEGHVDVAFPAFELTNEEGDRWHVCKDQHGWRCDCPAHNYQQKSGLCKHGRAVQALWERGLLS